MQCNVGQKDKKLRIWGGAAVLLTAVTLKSAILAVIAVALIISGWKRFCFAYKLLGIDTTKNDSTTPPAV
jgi:Protein of unknown function (DUF2892)